MVLKTLQLNKQFVLDLSSVPEGKAQVALNLNPFVGEWHGRVSLKKGQSCSSMICFFLLDGACSVSIAKSATEVPDNTYLIINEKDGLYEVLIALSHSDMNVSLSGLKKGLSISVTSGSSRLSNRQRAALVYSSHTNLQKAIARAMDLSLRRAGEFGQMLKLKPSLPSWLKSLSWESDFGIGKNTSHKLIYDSVKLLKEAGIPIKYVIIDDGWQTLSSCKNGLSHSLLCFQADQKRFPRGLRGLVNDLRSLGISKVGISHSMMGAPDGIHPKLAKKYELPPDSKGRYFLGYNLGRTFEFYCDFYRYVKQEGISFIKVVGQNEIPSFCREGMDVTAIYQYLQEAIQAASSLQFNSAHMNADCLNPANLFYWSTSQIARGISDLDLSCQEKVGAFFRDNLLVSLWLRHLMVPDFGSWMTKTPYSYPLAMFHALSGGLHSIGDLLGDVNKSLIEKISLPSGKLARSSSFLTPTNDSLFIDPLKENKIYKAYIITKFQGALWGVNLTEESRGVVGSVSPSDVVGIDGELFCTYSFKKGFIGKMEREERIKCRLKPTYSDIWTFSKIVDGIAVIGMPRFFLMSNFIKAISLDDNYLHISTSIYAPILVYSERKILEVRCNNIVIPWNYDMDKKLLLVDESTTVKEELTEFTIAFE